ncbi:MULTISPECIES: APH(3')-I family aminoglycoside O-phosphotransferase [unclassified Sphingobium]|uniref:APH(3')-I family aminoglycoside O-phosphotransferase n=1 Tax=unclassified Sphingobium TaxID=2611147 RepID=UPI0035A61629
MLHVDREESCTSISTPAGLSDEVAGYQWARSKVGESGATVYRLHGKAGEPDLYLKHGEGRAAGDLVDEMCRLHWLAGRIAAPTIRHFFHIPGESWLLMTAMPGETAYQVLTARPGERAYVVDAMADFLRRFHDIPVSECPFNSDYTYRLRLARERIDAGLIDQDDFDEGRAGWTAEQIWQAMTDLLPLAPDPVVTHGDFSLDNLLMVDGAVIGCIDAGRVGVADRYQDVAIAWNCLGEFGDGLQDRFLERYGTPRPDTRKLRFHLMLDELF